MLYASWRCGAASLVMPGGAACLHVRAQSCNYWFFCREAEALMSARHGSSGFACLVCLLQNKVTFLHLHLQPFLQVYCEFPSHFPNSAHSYQLWSYIALESRGCSVPAQRWLPLSETPLVPCSTSELVASWFKMSFICSRNSSANDLVSAEILRMPPTRCFLNTEGDTVPSKDKRWGKSTPKKNDLGAERCVLLVKVDVCGFAPSLFSVKSTFHLSSSFSHSSNHRSFFSFARVPSLFLPFSICLSPRTKELFPPEGNRWANDAAASCKCHGRDEQLQSISGS